ncbi:GH3 auxin-responsive promoter family protein [Porphyromonas cangingivalis]|uniref:GH3 auxin-responsive promoter family protein n=1 Tax=Porphyromonas cangingivalis TaxID=36874 RepID=UPI00051D9E02|nr:GH3 auxin-responsive promoter family protein [Porphyromonas cangingivalis]KGL50250.1 hypothetical protein HQ34_01045 [Porphyromonas cangingivalis]
MDTLTSLYTLLYRKRPSQIAGYATHAMEIQARQLREITRMLARTEYGRKHGITDRIGYSTYAERLPIVMYEDLAPYVERMLAGEQRVLCGERTEWFAKSSGTTNAKSKYIPVPPTHLSRCHFRGSKDVLSLFIRNNPETKVLSHKSFALSGSLSKGSYGRFIKAGDLSAVLVSKFPIWARSLRVPSIEVALLEEWEEKLDRTSDALVRADIATLSGVPSWMLVIVKEAMRKAGAKTAKELWPDLEVFFHGGIAFDPYRDEYRRVLGEGVKYMETYNASEGFFGIQDDPSDSSMLLMLDYGVYYEFIPMDVFDESDLTNAIPLHKVSQGINYAMVISTLGGLYRYIIGDTVRFTSTAPYKFVITGRTKSFINAFGEELMVANADKALDRAAKESGARLREYSAGPVFLTEEGKGYHHWVVEFEEEPKDIARFASLLDEGLKALNSDYEAKRYKDISLQPPLVTVVREGTFFGWMKEHGKLGGQHKVPRLSKDDSIIRRLIELSDGQK